MPVIGGAEPFCPLELCYPGTQAWHPSWVSRKSACDPVSFSNPPNWTIVWIADPVYLD
jgi:hypothetical protein